MTFPIVVSTGKRLFGASEDAKVLELVGSRRLNSGTVIPTYRPVR